MGTVVLLVVVVLVALIIYGYYKEQKELKAAAVVQQSPAKPASESIPKSASTETPNTTAIAVPEVGTINSFVPTTLPVVYFAIMHTNERRITEALTKNATLYVEVFKDADVNAALKAAQARLQVRDLNYRSIIEKKRAEQPNVTRLLLRVTALNKDVIFEEKIIRQIPMQSLLS